MEQILKNKGLISPLKLMCFVLIILFCSCLYGCNFTNKNTLLLDSLKYDTIGENRFSFNVSMITIDPNPNINFISFSGDNTEQVIADCKIERYNGLGVVQHKGKYLSIVCFECETKAEYLKINEIKVKINDKECTYYLKVPIEHRVEPERTQAFISGNIAVNVQTSTLDNTKYYFDTVVQKDVELIGVSFNNYLYLKSGTLVYVNDEFVGSLDSIYSLRLKKGDKLSVDGYIGLADDSFPSYDWIYCNYELTYLENNQEQVFKSPFVCEGVLSKDDARAVISSKK